MARGILHATATRESTRSACAAATWRIALSSYDQGRDNGGGGSSGHDYAHVLGGVAVKCQAGLDWNYHKRRGSRPGEIMQRPLSDEGT